MCCVVCVCDLFDVCLFYLSCGVVCEFLRLCVFCVWCICFFCCFCISNCGVCVSVFFCVLLCVSLVCVLWCMFCM